jgi:two-component system, chemotaxis family, sensor kinase CheA
MIGPIETFQTEAREHLEAFESTLLDLESDHSNLELINRAFRSMHTIKGGAGMFGFQQLTEFTHHVENLLDLMRNGDVDIDGHITGLLLSIGDFTSQLIYEVAFTDEQMQQAKKFIESIEDLLPSSSKNTVSESCLDNAPKIRQAGFTSVFRVVFKPDLNSFKSGMDVYPIFNEFKQLGECHTTVITSHLPELGHYDPESSYLGFESLLVTSANRQVVEDVFMFVIDDWDVLIDELDLSDTSEESDRVGEILLSRGLISVEQLNQALADKPLLGNLLENNAHINPEQLQSALVEQEVTRTLKQNNAVDGANSTIRVPAQKLDSLMNLVGELVIVQARLNQYATNSEEEEILSIAEELDLLTNQMRDETFGIRLIPIGSTFGRFRRLVRDLSVELGKSIKLETDGAETELDKLVIDKLGDPLVHIIRNSIDHGIELPEIRSSLGKPAEANILLKAEHAESHVVITVSDDGKGLDTSVIRDKAIAKGIITGQEDLTDEQIHLLIFEPGFSTANKVSDISGRGVGMDVVKRSIQELGGKVSLKSKQGEGTQVKIILPMTLAIIEGLLVVVGDEHFVLPLNSVEECMELPRNMPVGRRRLLEVRGEQIPYISLRSYFSVAGESPPIEQVVVIHSEDQQFGFCVDEVVGQYQTVIKRLGRFYEGVVGFSGATIMGDGNVAMVLDPQAIIESVTI